MSRPQVMRPIYVGPAKCARKGHRPLTKYGVCTRCKEFIQTKEDNS